MATSQGLVTCEDPTRIFLDENVLTFGIILRSFLEGQVILFNTVSYTLCTFKHFFIIYKTKTNKKVHLPLSTDAQDPGTRVILCTGT